MTNACIEATSLASRDSRCLTLRYSPILLLCVASLSNVGHLLSLAIRISPNSSIRCWKKAAQPFPVCVACELRCVCKILPDSSNGAKISHWRRAGSLRRKRGARARAGQSMPEPRENGGGRWWRTSTQVCSSLQPCTADVPDNRRVHYKFRDNFAVWRKYGGTDDDDSEEQASTERFLLRVTNGSQFTTSCHITSCHMSARGRVSCRGSAVEVSSSSQTSTPTVLPNESIDHGDTLSSALLESF